MARPVGALDKNKKFLLGKLKDMYGEKFDPIMRAAALAHQLDSMLDEKPELLPMAIDKWLKIGEFTNGKVSAITLSNDPENPIAVPMINSKMPHVEATQIYRESLNPNKPH